MRALLLPLSLACSAFGAAAQDVSRDRAELDAAAGRTLFQPTPISQSIAPSEPPPPPRVIARAEPGASRRGVRVVYPGLYGR